jgi:hypothetical protein
MNTRPIASLTPTLLARKGAARPAMRPQLQPLRAFQDNAARQLDDLGWNDMGGDTHEEPIEDVVAPPTVAEVFTLAPAVELVEDQISEAQFSEAQISEARVPEVVRQQEGIAERLAAVRRPAREQGRRAAFTLRLDAERHLKLKLACVAKNRSAQQIVTEALDRLIADLPELADLAAKVGKAR